MRIKVYLILLLANVFYTFITKAQDPHFSQYFSSPLTLNPANTGFFDGDFRLAVNQRQQWWNIGANYNTTSISADIKLKKEELPEFDTFAIGISGIFDKSLNGALKSNYVSASAAYHKSLAPEGRQTLAVGFQATYADRYIDYTKLSFASQFNVDFFDTSIPANLNYDASSTKYLDVNVGLLYALHSDRVNAYLGVSLYHANKPVESLFNGPNYTVPYRKNVHFGAEYNVGDQSSILLSAVYMRQQNITDQLIGVAYGLKNITDYYHTNTTKLYVGVWYRVNEAIIPYVGIDYNNFGVGLNYSATSPTSSVYIYQPRTFEVSLIYRHKSPLIQSSACPRF